MNIFQNFSFHRSLNGAELMLEETTFDEQMMRWYLFISKVIFCMSFIRLIAMSWPKIYPISWAIINNETENWFDFYFVPNSTFSTEYVTVRKFLLPFDLWSLNGRKKKKLYAGNSRLQWHNFAPPRGSSMNVSIVNVAVEWMNSSNNWLLFSNYLTSNFKHDPIYQHWFLNLNLRIHGMVEQKTCILP